MNSAILIDLTNETKTLEELREVVTDRTIVVKRDIDGIEMTPETFKVTALKNLGESPTLGRTIEFSDENSQHRVIPVAEIVRVR